MKKRAFILILLAFALLAFGCAKQNVNDGFKNHCTLYIDCRTILDNMGDLDPEKAELIPEDGVLLDTVTVGFNEGESVYDLLIRELKARKIHIEASFTPVYNTAYIEGIGNIYEFDCGPMSGWEYCVNGEFPNYGCSQYRPKEGDEIRFLYTCELGADIGDDYNGD